MPLLIRGLDLPNASIRADIIDTLLSVADPNSTPPSIISDHAATLVSTMLRNCKAVGEVTSAVCLTATVEPRLMKRSLAVAHLSVTILGHHSADVTLRCAASLQIQCHPRIGGSAG